MTKQAVQNYQKANKLTETGIADIPTLEKITKKTSTSTETQTTTLKNWSPWTSRYEPTRPTKTKRFPPINPTGYFGTNTEAAVKQFQLRNGLNVLST
ncbi:peptidoglycan-binding protein [Anaerobacillus sp. HL2]|nr:peptidoglycan-binding protein [Anaerobacillus sp. HL2]